MRNVLVCLVASVALLGGCAAPEEGDDADTSADAVVGGTVANHEHPEVVYLEMFGESCTGTLVGRRTILTARHCLEHVKVTPDGRCLGRAFVDTAGEGAGTAPEVPFERCVIPDLGDPTWRNDFGFVRLARPVTGVVPAKIATTKPAGETFTAYGYGMLGERSCTDRPDLDKRKVTYSANLSRHSARLMCPGDSGGPHFVAGTNVIAAVTHGRDRLLGADLQSTTYSYPEHLKAYLANLEAE